MSCPPDRLAAPGPVRIARDGRRAAPRPGLYPAPDVSSTSVDTDRSSARVWKTEQ